MTGKQASTAEGSILFGAAHIGTYPLIGGILKKTGKKKQTQTKQAASGSTHTAVMRSKTKESQYIKISTHLRESDAHINKLNKFKVILIKEGLGNLKDCFFYTKECLKTAVNTRLFEGKKCFADHPTAVEEQTRPERSTRDIIGYFEDCEYLESKDGQGMIGATLCVQENPAILWANSLMTNALGFSKKYPNDDFVGLSINASGTASTVALSEFVESSDLSPAIKSKLALAAVEGVSEIRVVNLLREAVSCDLVTSAGAGGKILQMIEGEKKMEKKIENETAEKKENAGAAPADATNDDGHADAAQDKDLFEKMIKQYLGDDADQSEEAKQMAQHAYETHKEGGMNEEEAYQAAGNHLKMAMAIGKKMAGGKEAKQNEGEETKPAEADDEAEDKTESAPAVPPASKKAPKESEAKKESDKKIIALTAQVAKLTESLKKHETEKYLESKLTASKKPVAVTKKFREALGVPKSKEHIDSAYTLFMKAYEAGSEGADEASFVFTEKNQAHVTEDEKSVSFKDCVK